MNAPAHRENATVHGAMIRTIPSHRRKSDTNDHVDKQLSSDGLIARQKHSVNLAANTRKRNLKTYSLRPLVQTEAVYNQVVTTRTCAGYLYRLV